MNMQDDRQAKQALRLTGAIALRPCGSRRTLLLRIVNYFRATAPSGGALRS
jgi:hypothetical protein